MKLAEYLKANSIPLTTFAADLGEKVTTVHGWVSRRRRPGVVSLARIEAVTSNQVRAADFLDDKTDAPDPRPYGAPSKAKAA